MAAAGPRGDVPPDSHIDSQQECISLPRDPLCTWTENHGITRRRRRSAGFVIGRSVGKLRAGELEPSGSGIRPERGVPIAPTTAGLRDYNDREVDLPLVKRFWLPRGTNPDLSDDGFLVNPQSKYSRYAPATAVPFESIARYPVLGLLGEPGIGKTTALRREADLTRAAALQSGDRVLWVDLGLYGTDLFLDQKVFQSRSFRSWKKSESRLCLFLDGLDECLHRIDNLVPTCINNS